MRKQTLDAGRVSGSRPSCFSCTWTSHVLRRTLLLPFLHQEKSKILFSFSLFAQEGLLSGL